MPNGQVIELNKRDFGFFLLARSAAPPLDWSLLPKDRSAPMEFWKLKGHTNLEMCNSFLVKHGQNFVCIWNRTSCSIKIIGSINCSRHNFMQHEQIGATCLFGLPPKRSLFESKEMTHGFWQMWLWSNGYSWITFIRFVENVIARNIVVGNFKKRIGTIDWKFTQRRKRKNDGIAQYQEKLMNENPFQVSDK